MPTVSIGCDHGGFALKQALLPAIRELGFEIHDAGSFTPERSVYVPHAFEVAQAVSEGQSRFGILICCTGLGVSMVANRTAGVRAALCHDITSARLTRQHNNANILCMGGKIIGEWTAYGVVKVFLTTEFLGGRYQNVIDMF
jgi:ribose 5-phosphate isomerase B